MFIFTTKPTSLYCGQSRRCSFILFACAVNSCPQWIHRTLRALNEPSLSLSSNSFQTSARFLPIEIIRKNNYTPCTYHYQGEPYSDLILIKQTITKYSTNYSSFRSLPVFRLSNNLPPTMQQEISHFLIHKQSRSTQCAT